VADDQHEVQVRRANNRAAIALLRRWLKEGPVCDEKTWKAFKRSIEEGRLSDRERWHIPLIVGSPSTSIEHFPQQQVALRIIVPHQKTFLGSVRLIST
jgi:hypothetical protein